MVWIVVWGIASKFPVSSCVFGGTLQIIDYEKESFLCDIPNALENGLKPRLQLLQQDGGKCRMYLVLWLIL